MHGAATRLKDHHHTRYAAKVCGAEESSGALMLRGSASLLCLGVTTKLVLSRAGAARTRQRRQWMTMPPPRFLPSSDALSLHSSSCVLARDDGHGVLGTATIWHALLPTSLSSSSTPSYHRRFPAAAAFKDGSWNAAGDARPARWLQGPHSAWLLFGFCACFSRSLACVDGLAHHGKKVHKDFTVVGIPGDGRCLFRAVAHGVCAGQGKPTSDEDSQRGLADELRGQVVDELVKRRADCEWFIEGDFDLYTQRMRQAHVWGGEPELLMLSHVLKSPITVYMAEASGDGLIAIAEYGQEYRKQNLIRVLYHGFGHYDALLMSGDTVE